MTIAFACPNGHPLTAPENLAGKPGQCPRCNTRFLIPTLEEVAAAAGDSAGGEPASEASSAAVSNAPPSPPAPPPPKSPAPASA
ncbi:MAG TPA: hypothetical protein PLV92_30655, partial [Pirellulaceae bacterium]|nr:hypothetical protein [Pirellulaceae bacterium]